jgi:nucleotide-binding universal stress UspA family protein
MTEMKKILFPYDLSESAREVIPYVRSLAEGFNSDIYLLHVIADLGKWGKVYIPHTSMDSFQKEASQTAEKAMEALCHEELKGCSVAQRKVISGDPATEILSALQADDIDLLIMGTHGRKGLEHAIFGSVAEEVVKKSAVPVMTVNPSKSKRPEAGYTFKKVLFPMDFSECAETVFPEALALAKRFEARLFMLFVARDISYLTTVDVSRDLLNNTVAEVARAGEEKMEAFCSKQLADFSDYEAKVAIGSPADEILRYGNEQGVHVIVMGTHGRRGLERTLMGSVADHVMKNASSPVITMNPFKAKVKHVHS